MRPIAATVLTGATPGGKSKHTPNFRIIWSNNWQLPYTLQWGRKGRRQKHGHLLPMQSWMFQVILTNKTNTNLERDFHRDRFAFLWFNQLMWLTFFINIAGLLLINIFWLFGWEFLIDGIYLSWHNQHHGTAQQLHLLLCMSQRRKAYTSFS